MSPQCAKTCDGGWFGACILDVDGVLLASPHERAWREALDGFADPALFTTAIYQAEVAGKPRQAGALAALLALNVISAGDRAAAYAERKQARLEALMRAGAITAYPDALRFVEALLGLDIRLAVASSSKNANHMMESVHLASGRPLLDVFDANLCGRDLRKGKPDPEIFLLAAAEVHVASSACLVVEDASAGVMAARAGGMTGLGVARLGDSKALREAGASLVVESLDEVAISELAQGRLCRVLG